MVFFVATGTSPLIASAPTISELKTLVYIQNTALTDNSSFLDQTGLGVANRAIKDDLKDDLKEWVRVTYPEIYRVVNCESGWDNLARGQAGEIGLAQFMPATWEMFNEMRKTNLDIFNPQDQVDMVIFAFEKEKYKKLWTCYFKEKY